MDSNNYDDELDYPKRPTFLTVLCILTFIGSGFGILSSVWSYATARKTINTLNEFAQKNTKDSLFQKDTVSLRKQKVSSEYNIGARMGASMRTMMTVDNIHKKSIGDLIAGLFTLAGALLMWWQKRTGFYLYIVGVAIGIALPFYLFGNDLITVGMASFGAFFGLLFIALYAINIKSLTK